MEQLKKKQKYDSGFDPGQDTGYQAALGQLEAARKQQPVYESAYAGEASGLYDALQNRESFSYDINSDALYRQYRDQYVREGRLAMADTLGRAQAMTGGYGNSYAQTAGQQTYQQYLGALQDRIPQLYSQALARYQAEGTALQQRYQMAKDLENQEYSRYRDQVADYQKTLAQLQSNADTAYNRSYQNYMDGYAMQKDQQELLRYLVENHGYSPSWQELLAVGLSPEQVLRLQQQSQSGGSGTAPGGITPEKYQSKRNKKKETE